MTINYRIYEAPIPFPPTRTCIQRVLAVYRRILHTFLILNMPSSTRIPKPKTKKLGHKITSLYRSTKFTQLHDVGIKEIISSGDGAFHSQCEVFHRRRKLQKNTKNIIQMRSNQIAGM